MTKYLTVKDLSSRSLTNSLTRASKRSRKFRSTREALEARVKELVKERDDKSFFLMLVLNRLTYQTASFSMSEQDEMRRAKVNLVVTHAGHTREIKLGLEAK